MEPMATLGVDLFTLEAPTVEQITQARDFVFSCELNQKRFEEQLNAQLDKATPMGAGVGLLWTGHVDQAVEKLQQAPDSSDKFRYLGAALRKARRFDEALECFKKAIDHQGDTLKMTMEKVATLRQAGRYEEALAVLEKCANYENVSAEYHFQRGRLCEAQGLYGEAIDNFQVAVELAPDHKEAMFHLARRADLCGNEDAAIEVYEQLAAHPQVHVAALLNLAVLYEDKGQFDKASQCVNAVLMQYPNHPRATLFNKDIESSKTMYFDEEKEKKRTRKNQILETPISDFELSVRSRNCLKKMNIRTLGDLLNITEAELLSYKNFGETSLKEIKAILDTKGLSLGMALDDKQFNAHIIQEQISTEDDGLLAKPVDELNLSVRARKCLQKLNLRTIGDLTRTTEAELLGCKNFGVTSLNEISKALVGIGLSLRKLD